MKKRFITLILSGLSLLSSAIVFAAPGGGGGNNPPAASAGCGAAVNGNGTFGAPSNRQRQRPRSSMCTLWGGNSSNYTYISAFSITYNSVWAATPSYNVTTTYNWTCSVAGVGGGSSASCGVGRVSWCGPAKGQSFASAPTWNLCDYGTPSAVGTTSSSYVWTCYSATSYSTVGNVSYTDTCTANRLIASCGSSHGKLLMSPPTTNLCNGGTASAVSSAAAATYNWTCGYSGAPAVSCAANKAIMTPQCTDAAYAAADYTSCMNGGTCNCYNMVSTGATSSYTPATATYSGRVTFQQDTVGSLFLSSPTGAGPLGALMIGYNGAGLAVGAGVAGINTALPGAALDMKGLVRVAPLAGTALQRVMISSTGFVTTGGGPLSWWIHSGVNFSNALGGNVGIGTATPTDKLQVMGNAKANAFLTSSDETLKTEIYSLGSMRGKIKRLEPVAFIWKTDGTRDIGFIAQDVEKLFPELVTTDSVGQKSLKYSNLVAPVVMGIKELHTTLTLLGEEKLQQQEKEIAQLEQRLEKIRTFIKN